MPDGTVFYVEEVRTKRKQLATKTMYKNKPPKGGKADGR
jgi:hypothetical protein